MGTLVEITVAAPRERALEAAQAVIDEIKRVEDLASFHKDSKLAKVNAHAGKGPVKTDPELLALIENALDCARETQGAFDPTIGPLTRLWNFSGGGDPRLPSPEEIGQAREKVGWSRIRMDREAGTVEAPDEGMALDLGGIAKGYALDRARSALERLGVRNALVNAGGDVLILGEKDPGLPWRVGIQDPRSPKEIMGLVHASDCFVVTSGDYERRIEVNGKTYHHILDPRTGYPAEGVRSVTVKAPQGWLADGLSTGVFVLGAEKGGDLIKRLQGTAALIVNAQGISVTVKNDEGLFELRR
jgi:thiamine biosynthesis lipoprotein